MNTNTPVSNSPAASGIHPGVWIGGGLMSLAIVALATTLIVKSNDAAAPAQVAATTVGTQQSPVIQAAAGTGQPMPAREAARPEHRRPVEEHRESARYADAQQVAAANVCSSCGVIDSYSTVQVKGQNNGIGAVAGGLGGALVGSKIAGRNDHTIGGVIGAVGGGLLGNAIESHERVSTAYDVRVRMADGSIRTVRQSTLPNVGQHVSIDGDVLRATGI